MTRCRVPLSWWGWGDPALVPELPDTVQRLLRDGLGVTAGLSRPGSAAEVQLAPVRLAAELAARFVGVVGAAYASDQQEDRLRHALGKSTPDLLVLRGQRRAPLPAPDLVLAPASHEEVVELLALASESEVAVVPFGGGTSVVGGLTPRTGGWIALDLRRLDALVELDEISRIAVLEPGLRGPDAEALLGERGYTIGHFPQSYEYATLGGFAAARSSGQASAGYGRFDERVLGVRLATPAGMLELGRAPRSAAGPDLRQLVLGSEGAFGVITRVTVAVRPLPTARVYEGWRFTSFAEGAAALRGLVQDGPRPTVLRLSDEAETALNLARPAELGSAGGGCLAIVGFEGESEAVDGRRAAVSARLRGAGAAIDLAAGEAWSAGRFHGPYLRDALLDAGALVETLETACFWSRLPQVYAAVSGALRAALEAAGTPPVILCHISHVYPAGASLYFTVGAAAAADPIDQWQAAKRAAGDAMLAAGATITHHHGVGRDHAPWLEAEIGSLGVAALRAVKRTLDPAGIMNPGALIDEEAGSGGAG
ncbi:MAG TPA: FAD-binding oxidoreductase [Solirubrobacteraceae bacterium]|nr:FAD-binding oxidoreductase [Solirubrobacteraceae bacterium]